MFPLGNVNKQYRLTSCSHYWSFDANNTNNPDLALLQTTWNILDFNANKSFCSEAFLIFAMRNQGSFDIQSNDLPTKHIKSRRIDQRYNRSQTNGLKG